MEGLESKEEGKFMNRKGTRIKYEQKGRQEKGRKKKNSINWTQGVKGDEECIL